MMLTRVQRSSANKVLHVMRDGFVVGPIGMEQLA